MTSPLLPEDIAEAFRQAGIGRGDLLMLHSDSMVLAQLPAMSTEARCAAFFAAVDQVLGAEGTLVLPTFTYSFTKNENFNVLESPSTVGMLTNFFRTMPGVVRSQDPNFSVAAKGPLAKELTDVESDDCFGPHSVFALLEKHQAKLAGMGCSIDRFTYVHYLEQKAGVDYRYYKNFSGWIESGGSSRFAEVKYFVRDVNRRTELKLASLHDVLAKRGELITQVVGRVPLYVVSCTNIHDAVMALLAKNPSALIAEGYAEGEAK